MTELEHVVMTEPLANTHEHQPRTAEVSEGLLGEREALALARRFMVENARACFRLERD